MAEFQFNIKTILETVLKKPDIAPFVKALQEISDIIGTTSKKSTEEFLKSFKGVYVGLEKVFRELTPEGAIGKQRYTFALSPEKLASFGIAQEQVVKLLQTLKIIPKGVEDIDKALEHTLVTLSGENDVLKQINFTYVVGDSILAKQTLDLEKLAKAVVKVSNEERKRLFIIEQLNLLHKVFPEAFEKAGIKIKEINKANLVQLENYRETISLKIKELEITDRTKTEYVKLLNTVSKYPEIFEKYKKQISEFPELSKRHQTELKNEISQAIEKLKLAQKHEAEERKRELLLKKINTLYASPEFIEYIKKHKEAYYAKSKIQKLSLDELQTYYEHLKVLEDRFKREERIDRLTNERKVLISKINSELEKQGKSLEDYGLKEKDLASYKNYQLKTFLEHLRTEEKSKSSLIISDIKRKEIIQSINDLVKITGAEGEALLKQAGDLNSKKLWELSVLQHELQIISKRQKTQEQEKQEQTERLNLISKINSYEQINSELYAKLVGRAENLNNLKTQELRLILSQLQTSERVSVGTEQRNRLLSQALGLLNHIFLIEEQDEEMQKLRSMLQERLNGMTYEQLKTELRRLDLISQIYKYGQNYSFLQQAILETTGIDIKNRKQLLDLSLENALAVKKQVELQVQSYTATYRNRLEMDRVVRSIRAWLATLTMTMSFAIRDAIRYSIELQKLRAVYNMTNKDAIFYLSIAEAVNIRADELVKSIGNFYQKLITAGQGTSLVAARVREALEKVGLSGIKLGEVAFDASMSLDTLREVWKQLPDAQSKAYVGQMLLGGEFEKMIPLLEMSDKDYNKIRATIGDVGDAFKYATGPLIAISVQFTILRLKIRSLAAEIATQIGPSIEEVLKMFGRMAELGSFLLGSMPRVVTIFTSFVGIAGLLGLGIMEVWVHLGNVMQRIRMIAHEGSVAAKLLNRLILGLSGLISSLLTQLGLAMKTIILTTARFLHLGQNIISVLSKGPTALYTTIAIAVIAGLALLNKWLQSARKVEEESRKLLRTESAINQERFRRLDTLAKEGYLTETQRQKLEEMKKHERELRAEIEKTEKSHNIISRTKRLRDLNNQYRELAISVKNFETNVMKSAFTLSKFTDVGELFNEIASSGTYTFRQKMELIGDIYKQQMEIFSGDAEAMSELTKKYQETQDKIREEGRKTIQEWASKKHELQLPEIDTSTYIGRIKEAEKENEFTLKNIEESYANEKEFIIKDRRNMLVGLKILYGQLKEAQKQYNDKYYELVREKKRKTEIEANEELKKLNEERIKLESEYRKRLAAYQNSYKDELQLDKNYIDAKEAIQLDRQKKIKKIMEEIEKETLNIEREQTKERLNVLKESLQASFDIIAKVNPDPAVIRDFTDKISDFYLKMAEIEYNEWIKAQKLTDELINQVSPEDREKLIALREAKRTEILSKAYQEIISEITKFSSSVIQSEKLTTNERLTAYEQTIKVLDKLKSKYPELASKIEVESNRLKLEALEWIKETKFKPYLDVWLEDFKKWAIRTGDIFNYVRANIIEKFKSEFEKLFETLAEKPGDFFKEFTEIIKRMTLTKLLIEPAKSYYNYLVEMFEKQGMPIEEAMIKATRVTFQQVLPMIPEAYAEVGKAIGSVLQPVPLPAGVRPFEFGKVYPSGLKEFPKFENLINNIEQNFSFQGITSTELINWLKTQLPDLITNTLTQLGRGVK